MGTAITSDVYRDDDLCPTISDTILALLARIRQLESRSSADVGMPQAQMDDSPDNYTGLSNTGANYGETYCGVSFTAPDSGKVKISLNAMIHCQTAGSAYAGIFVRTGSTVGSGTLVYDCTVDPGCKISTNITGHQLNGSCSTILSGLTPGASYNAAAVTWVGGGTMAYYGRQVAVEPMF